MNTSAGVVGEVPLGVVTVTFTGPELELIGLLTVIDVPPLLTVKSGEFSVPKSTAVAPVKLLPVIVTMCRRPPARYSARYP